MVRFIGRRAGRVAAAVTQVAGGVVLGAAAVLTAGAGAALIPAGFLTVAAYGLIANGVSKLAV